MTQPRESAPGLLGPITLGAKHPEKRSAGNLHAAFDVAGAGNVARGAGLRPRAKALGKPPDRAEGAPVLDPTWEGGEGEAPDP